MLNNHLTVSSRFSKCVICSPFDPDWPREEAVAAITLHPTHLAKNYCPSELFNAVGLDVVGSEPKKGRWRDPVRY